MAKVSGHMAGTTQPGGEDHQPIAGFKPVLNLNCRNLINILVRQVRPLSDCIKYMRRFSIPTDGLTLKNWENRKLLQCFISMYGGRGGFMRRMSGAHADR